MGGSGPVEKGRGRNHGDLEGHQHQQHPSGCAIAPAAPLPPLRQLNWVLTDAPLHPPPAPPLPLSFPQLNWVLRQAIHLVDTLKARHTSS